MSETYGSTWRFLTNYNRSVPATLCRQWVKQRFEQILDRRMWSFQWGHGAWIVKTPITGNANISLGSNQVTFTSAVLPGDNSIVGWQLFVNGQLPFYTVIQGGSTTVVKLDRPVVEPSASSVPCKVWQAFFMSERPDFEKLISMIDRQNQWQFRKNVPQEEINNIDAQRSFASPPEWLSGLGFNDEYLAALPSGITDYYSQTNASQPQPYFEAWPQTTAAKSYPYLYKRRTKSFSSDDDLLPGFIRARVLQEGALADMCGWPGTESLPNRKFNPVYANMHEKKFENYVVDMIFRDEQATQRTLFSMAASTQFPYGPMSSRYWQNHVDTSVVTG